MSDRVEIHETGVIEVRTGYKGDTGATGPKGDTGATGPAIGGLLTTKGDLVARDATNAVRVPVGANGAALVADSAQAAGVRWTTARYFEGSGFPEGVVTAPVGARYIDTAATNGAVEWIKASGTGATGWRVVYGDTGTREVKSLLSANFTVAALHLSRRDNTVFLVVNQLAAVATGATVAALSLPAGFQPAGTTHRWAPTGTSTYQPYVVAGSLYVDRTDTVIRTWNVMWRTLDNWPATLPGTAA